MFRSRAPRRRALAALAAIPATRRRGATRAVQQRTADHRRRRRRPPSGHRRARGVVVGGLRPSAGRRSRSRSGLFVAEHDDAEINGSGFALCSTTAGSGTCAPARRRRIARAIRSSTTTAPTRPPAASRSAGATTGAVEHGHRRHGHDRRPGRGRAGTRAAGAYVLTYDGINNGVPTWVDHAPGGTAPTDPSVGADYIVGSCGAAPRRDHDRGAAERAHDGHRPQDGDRQREARAARAGVA